MSVSSGNLGGTGSGLGQRIYGYQDANYNVTSITDPSGNVLERYMYDPYGKVTVLNAQGAVQGTGSAASSLYGWIYLHQGTRLDLTSGLYSVRFRDYSPVLGRWMEQEPAGYINGSNTYQALESSPASNVDPLGLQVESEPDPTDGEDPNEDPGLENAREGLGPSEPTPPPTPGEAQFDQWQQAEEFNKLFPPQPPPYEPPDNNTSQFDQGVFKAAQETDKGIVDYPDPESAPAPDNTPTPSIPHPGDIPRDQPPGPQWEWRGQPPVGGGQGNWYNPFTGESLYNDMQSNDHDPHWDYRQKGEDGKWRWYPDGILKHNS